MFDKFLNTTLFTLHINKQNKKNRVRTNKHTSYAGVFKAMEKS